MKEKSLQYKREMFNMIKSKIIKDAVEQERWEDLRELAKIDYKHENKVWYSGFVTGCCSVTVGIVTYKLIKKKFG